MANPEHLATREKGVDAWNKWRADKPGLSPDRGGARLGDRDLREVNFADVTDARWVTVETQRIVRESPSVPFRLIKHESASVPSPIEDLRAEFEPPLIKPFSYKSLDHALDSIEEILNPAEQMAKMIRAKRKAIEDDPW